MDKNVDMDSMFQGASKFNQDISAWVSLYMLAAAFMIGCTTIIIRHLGKLDDPVCITFYFTVTGLLVSLLAIFFQDWQQPPAMDLALLIMVGFHL